MSIIPLLIINHSILVIYPDTSGQRRKKERKLKPEGRLNNNETSVFDELFLFFSPISIIDTGQRKAHKGVFIRHDHLFISSPHFLIFLLVLPSTRQTSSFFNLIVQYPIPQFWRYFLINLFFFPVFFFRLQQKPIWRWGCVAMWADCIFDLCIRQVVSAQEQVVRSFVLFG